MARAARAEPVGLLRRYTFKLYPNATQAAELDRQRVMHCRLYNGLLQQRQEAYERQRKSLTYFDQCKEITALRADDEDYRALSRASMDATAQRIDRAYQAYFKRWGEIKTNPSAKAKALADLAEKNAKRRAMGRRLLTLRDVAGFPHFKSAKLYPSIPFKAENTGWSFDLKGACDRGHRLRVQAVPGRIRARGKLPGPALEWRSCEILWRDGAWWLSLAVAMEPRRKAGIEQGRVELDLIDSFAVVRAADGRRLAGLEDPFGDERRNPYRSEGVAGEPPESPGERRDATGMTDIRRRPRSPESPGERRDATGSCTSSRVSSAPESPGERRDATGEGFVGARLVIPESPSGTGDATGLEVSSRPSPPPESPSERLARLQERVERLQQRIAGCHRGSLRYRRLGALKRRIEARQARIRRETLHTWSTKLQRYFAGVEIIAPPSVKDATTSGHGDARDWGAAVEPKAALNRRVLDQTPAAAVQMIEYKIAEAGGTVRVERRASHPVLVGNELRTVAKEARRTRRRLKKEAA